MRLGGLPRKNVFYAHRRGWIRGFEAVPRGWRRTRPSGVSRAHGRRQKGEAGLYHFRGFRGRCWGDTTLGVRSITSLPAVVFVDLPFVEPRAVCPYPELSVKGGSLVSKERRLHPRGIEAIVPFHDHLHFMEGLVLLPIQADNNCLVIIPFFSHVSPG